MNKNFGRILKDLRKKRGLSIKRLSSQLDVNYSYISKLENNHSNPSKGFIFKIAQLFDYDKEELLLRAGKVPDDILSILTDNPKEAADFLRKKFSENGRPTKKKLHKIKTTQKTYSLKNDFKYYKKILKDKKSKKILKESFKELKKIKKYKFNAVTSHHDININNVLFHKNSLKLIDWEFACVNDKFFDLANICFEFKLNEKQEKQVLKRYFKKIRKKDMKKLASYKIIYENLWILWFKNLEKPIV